MGIHKVQQLERAWYHPRDSSKSIETAMNSVFDGIGFTEEFVQRRIRSAHARRAHKTFIKDSVWGMISADAETVSLIDTPILQRLRRIRQLGLSYLVYPSAEHGRFSHSLGVYYVVSRFIDELRRSKHDAVDLDPDLAYAELSPDDERDLLHAALLHDTGHMPFSHATERILQEYRSRFRCGPCSVDDFMFSAEEHLEVSPALSEVLSLAIVLSPRFQHFYTATIRLKDREAPLRLAALIAGLRLKPNNRALTDLITSGLDADKIDYLCRDAAACKIALGIDVSRVFLRSSFVRVPYNRIPDGIVREEVAPNDSLTVFVVNASGIDTVEEIASARASMFQRVYYHQTTRCAERLLAKALVETLPEDGLPPSGSFGDGLKLWSLDDGSIIHLLAAHSEQRAAKIARRLLSRNLPKRAGAFGNKLVDQIVDLEEILREIDSSKAKTVLKQVAGSILDLLKAKYLAGDRLVKLEATIASEAVRVRNTLKSFFGDYNLPEGEPELVTVVSIPSLETPKVKDCFVLEPDGHLAHSRDYSTSSELADAADINKGIGYVYTDEDWRECVFIALRTILYRYGPPGSDHNALSRVGLVINDVNELRASHEAPKEVTVSFVRRFRIDVERACRRSKMDVESIYTRMADLESAGYYDETPMLASSIPPADVTSVAASLRDFVGQHGFRVTQASTVAFVNQFPPKFRKAAVELTKKIKLMGRSEIRRYLKNALTQSVSAHTNGTKYMTPLSPNSGQLVRTLFEQEEQAFLRDAGWTSCKSLREVLGKAKPGDIVALCDDNTSSGSQAEAQIRAWLGIPRADWPDEIRGERGIEDSSLSDNDRDRLKEMDLAVAVCTGSTEAGARLGNVLPGLGIRFKGVYFGAPIDADVADDLEELMPFLGDVGKSVLQFCRWGREHPGEDAPSAVVEACVRDALGYSGKRGVVCTMLSVPTSTLTALWCPGVYNGEPWVPLLLRRGYFEHLVIV